MNEGITISKEIAEQEFERFADYYMIDVEENKQFQRVITKALVKNIIEFEFDDDGPKIKHTTISGAELVYGVVSGTAKREMGKVGDNNIDRIYALMGSLSGVGTEAITKLKGRDNAIVEALAVFLA